MSFCFESVSLLVASLSFLILIAITAQSIVSESRSSYTLAAARYAIATHNEVIEPAAMALGKDPVSHGLTNCASFKALFSQLRGVHPSPQLEFAFLKRAIKATIDHKFLKSAVLDRKRGNGRTISTGGKHRLLHGLLAVDTVLQVTCENLNSSCSLPMPSSAGRTRTRREVPNANEIQTAPAEEPGDELDEHFDVFDENEYAESGQLEAAEKNSEQPDDSDETEVRIGLILMHNPGRTRKMHV